MLLAYFFAKPIYWILPWILQVIGYCFILKKMDLKRWAAVIPFIAEHEFCRRLYPKRRTFYRPFIISLILVLAALYVGMYSSMGRGFMIVAFIIYGIFLIRLYWRMTKALGRKRPFVIGLILIPPIFLMILGLGKSRFTQPEFKPEKERSRAARHVRRVIFVAISVVEILIIVSGVGFLAVRDTLPSFFVSYLLEDTYNKTDKVTGTGEVVSRDDVLDAKVIKNIKASRNHFYPSHKNDKNVVVFTYIVGSNLEGNMGLASANIHQMINATKQGEGLKFVVEAGGAQRWFTKGIADGSYGRYEIADGKITKLMDLPSDTSMSKAVTLGNFLKWAKKNYQADRYMLVLWDHGGGVPYGYGQDNVNKTENGTISVSGLVSAIKKSRMKFDMIGFDACLMQDIEIANALEPYADYFLASEETEGGFGWFYTSGFGKLARNPGISTEKFGREMVACYDPYNTIIKDDDGKPDTKATLSFVDLTLAAPAYNSFAKLLTEASAAIANDTAAYADIAAAADNAYSFEEDMQIDLIGFLKILDKANYDNTIGDHKERMALIKEIQASVLYRNAASAKGINGMSVALPYKSIGLYADTSKQLGKLSLRSEKHTFDEIFSIMAAQQKKGINVVRKDSESFTDMLMDQLGETDYTQQSWYIKGFEDYDNTRAFVDIPLKETENGYQIELPEKAWKIISDCQTMVFQKVDPEEGDDTGDNGIASITPGVAGYMGMRNDSTKTKTKKGTKKAGPAVARYLGKDQIGDEDEKGHPTIGMDNYWVHVEDQLVCYEAEPAMSTDEGDIYTGKIKALLNGKKEISLNVEWDPVSTVTEENGEIPPSLEGRITGYDGDSVLSFLHEKGSKNLKAGDKIQFLFDYYDAEGNLVETRPLGKIIRVTKQSRLKVKDQPIGRCEIQFGGVLTDVYQRVMTTEQIEMKISD